MQIFDSTMKDVLNERLNLLEQHFEADIIFYFGQIHPDLEKFFRDSIENLNENETTPKPRLVIFLNTPGGSAETVEKMVEIVRFHYKEQPHRDSDSDRQRYEFPYSRQTTRTG